MCTVPWHRGRVHTCTHVRKPPSNSLACLLATLLLSCMFPLCSCLCMGAWKPSFNSSSESRPSPDGSIHVPDLTRTTLFRGGFCGNPPDLRRQRDWCYVEYSTCRTQPAGRATSGLAADELWWDFCQNSTATLPQAAGAPRSVLSAG